MPKLLSIDRTDVLIDLPVRLALYEDGIIHLFGSLTKLPYFTTSEGTRSQGIIRKGLNAPTTQKLIINGYVREIYVYLPELLVHRNKIIDLTRLSVYGLLYKKMNPTLAKLLLQSPVILEFNKQNPTSAIRSLSHVPLEQAKKIMAQKAQRKEILELEIRNEVVERILEDANLSEEDRLMHIKSLDKFVKFIDDRIWYLYMIVYASPLKEKVKYEFADLIASYLDRTKIATHLANVIMELVQNAEKANFDKLLMEMGWISSADESFSWLKNSEKRKKLVALAASQQKFLEIAWRFHKDEVMHKKDYRLDIVVRNPGIMTHSTEKKLASKMNTDVTDTSLSDFFSESKEEKLGAGLGLLYISYLKEECQKAKLDFKTSVYSDRVEKKTEAMIQIVF
ncbi:MAG: hypothetical protein D6767_09955 [Candidatus Hydrogenedentota bacterium]|nr:MAG: hypothetical protein D6767_09955 [Candidatus Hydrogenedentota bacterium]